MIGKKLKELIKQRRFKQVDLARHVGISPSRLSNYLSDKREPDIEMLARMAKFLEVDLNYFTNINFGQTLSAGYPDAVELAGGASVREQAESYSAEDAVSVPLLPVNAKKRATHNNHITVSTSFLEGVIDAEDNVKVFEVNNPPMGSTVRDGDYLIAVRCDSIDLSNSDMIMETGRNCRFYRYYAEEGFTLLVSDDDMRESVRLSEESKLSDFYKILWVMKRP